MLTLFDSQQIGDLRMILFRQRLASCTPVADRPRFMPLLLAALALALAAVSAPMHRAEAATILLEIDATDPDAVSFVATDGAALASSTGVGFRFLLKDLLTGPVFVFTSEPNDLLAAQGGGPIDVLLGRGADLDLNGGGGIEQVFTQGERALTGSAAAALPATSLRADSTVGDITVRDNFGNDTGIVIGQYSYVAPAPVAPIPVPPSLALLATALAGAGLALRRSGLR